MNYPNLASLVNLLGFTVGVALYGLLLFMVMRKRKTAGRTSPEMLLLATSALGLLWNIGELVSFVRRDFVNSEVSPVLLAASFSALGFLPSVVVHSAQKSEKSSINWLTIAAYGLSIFAAALHFHSAFAYGLAPSNLALQSLTFGAIALIFGLLIFNFRQNLERKTIWASALLIFAVSALHLSGEAEETSFFIELIAHQSSLPLALAILFQDYRFAFADLFLKRAFSLILLAIAAFGLYVFVAAPLLHYHETHDRNDVQAIGLIITLWIATALIYPSLYRFAAWFVDKVILRRADYAKFLVDFAAEIEKLDSQKQILQKTCSELSTLLTVRDASWQEIDQPDSTFQTVNFTPDRAEIIMPTAEAPFYKITLQNFIGGRRLLSDEIEMLEKVALVDARNIDAVRVNTERFQQEIRRQEFAKLATQAQLTALRAQVNPHFLFNALTTVGYLIHTAPDKAFSTLMKLTGLLRGVLSSTKEFSTLEDEIALIENYLEIEKARFEERLEVEINIPKDLRKIRLPSLIVQPLVENAVKHGISKTKIGGKILISARLKDSGSALVLSVTDSGAGFDNVSEKSSGIGMKNIEQRLSNYYGSRAEFRIESRTGRGTRAEIVLPIETKGETRIKT